MSVKETILTNLKTALEEIAEYKGYSNSVALVTRKAIGYSDFREDQIPLIKISATTDEEFLTPVGSYQRVRWPIIIFAAVKGTDVETFATSFQRDIRKCLHAVDLGDNVIYTRLKGGPIYEGEDIIYWAEQLETVYYYSESDP
ncbi:MAG: hypothetical protein JSU85_13925 [Candidatus Zixiibacteriota bacterium]|nr:MAG: hypothetical protein JSU85_13925 [candidate division Zixibacteria bacterium]